MDKLYDVIIVGAGASGLFCAAKLCAAGVKAALLEKNERAGKKLLASGNGRCNIFNLSDGDFYSGGFFKTVAEKYPPQRLSDEFAALGVPVAYDGTLAYPASYRSACVLNALLQATQRADFFGGFSACDISRTKDGFRVASEDGRTVCGRRVVLACGSRASFGSDSLALADKLGLKIKGFSPALCPLECDGRDIRGTSGVRVKCAASIFANGEKLFSDSGEILFKDNALSGILSFVLSFYLGRTGAENGTAVLDLAPDFVSEKLEKYFAGFGGIKSASELLCCMFQKSVADNILRRARISEEINSKTAHMLAETIKNYSIDVRMPKGFSQAQVSLGGVLLDDFDESGMFFKGDPRVYVIGEMTEITGSCGGFNLMWAWRSALAAAENVIAEIKNG